MTEIVKFYPLDAAKNPDHVLEQALNIYEDVFIIGWDKEGRLDARSSLGLQGKDLLWLIEVFKKKLLDGDYSEE